MCGCEVLQWFTCVARDQRTSCKKKRVIRFDSVPVYSFFFLLLTSFSSGCFKVWIKTVGCGQEMENRLHKQNVQHGIQSYFIRINIYLNVENIRCTELHKVFYRSCKNNNNIRWCVQRTLHSLERKVYAYGLYYLICLERLWSSMK